MDTSTSSDRSVIAILLNELDLWKAKVEEATTWRDKLNQGILKQDEAKIQAMEDMNSVLEQQEKSHVECSNAKMAIQGDILRLQKENQDLTDQLKGCMDSLESQRTKNVSQELKFSAQIPDVKLKFSEELKEEEENGVSQHISGLYRITQRPTAILSGGQALVTFKERKVASQILKMAQCSVPLGQNTSQFRPGLPNVESVVKFGIQLDVSKKELMFSGVWPAMTQEAIRSRLESSFSRPSRGGGEVETVEYDPNTGTGKVTFLNTGVAEQLAGIGHYSVDLDKPVTVKVEPVIRYCLQRFQNFGCSPERTVLLDNVTALASGNDEEDTADMLEIFFQNPDNRGGDIESLKYLSKGKRLLALFDLI